MLASFTVEVHENGVVIIPIGLGAGNSIVYETKNIELALLEMYRRCTNWDVGDKIKIEKRT